MRSIYRLPLVGDNRDKEELKFAKFMFNIIYHEVHIKFFLSYGNQKEND